ncbi:MAG TPA: NAD-dependent epimerase/dehydratase family protein [Myxococcales bacterium]|nr:NAD-dependent epimerase/dehydratase family protein [Myxococcales bacterium]
MKVFLTGGSGYIGSAVALALKKAGHDVLALVRSEAKGEALKKAGVKLAVGELGNPAGYAGAAWGRAAFVHVAQDWSAEGPELDRRTISSARDLLRGQVGATFIYTSGCWVQGPTDGVADESTPTKPARAVSWRPAHEQAALEMARDGIRSVVVRPGIVYGGARGGIPAMFFGTALKHGAAQTVGGGENHWPLVHIDDLAELYVRLVERAPAGSVYYAADASRLTQREIAEAAARAAGKDGKIQPQQPDGTPYQEALTLDQQISSEKARNDLDWRPRHESFVAEASPLFSAWHAAQ